MNYLGLVNFAIEESGLELDLLDQGTWDSYVSGRRVYPRLKRYVRQSWKNIQMSRNQWEFGSRKVTLPVYPRFVIENITGGVPSPGDVFVGDDSDFSLEVRQLITTADGVVLEFAAAEGGRIPHYGEVFVDDINGTSFTFVGRGSYDFGLSVADLAEIQWETFTVTPENSAPIPALFIPYSSYLYDSYEYTHGARTAPNYVSQDYKGNVVFLHQTYQPFIVSFIYAAQPQELTDWDDEPQILPEAYHEWISWEAVKRIATYDKNPQLYAHAERNAQFFRNRAESNLMPHISWEGSRFNV